MYTLPQHQTHIFLTATYMCYMKSSISRLVLEISHFSPHKQAYIKFHVNPCALVLTCCYKIQPQSLVTSDMTMYRGYFQSPGWVLQNSHHQWLLHSNNAVCSSACSLLIKTIVYIWHSRNLCPVMLKLSQCIIKHHSKMDSNKTNYSSIFRSFYNVSRL